MMMSTELEGMWEEVVQLPKQLFRETTVKNVARMYGRQAGIWTCDLQNTAKFYVTAYLSMGWKQLLSVLVNCKFPHVCCKGFALCVRNQAVGLQISSTSTHYQLCRWTCSLTHHGRIELNIDLGCMDLWIYFPHTACLCTVLADYLPLANQRHLCQDRSVENIFVFRVNNAVPGISYLRGSGA